MSKYTPEDYASTVFNNVRVGDVIVLNGLYETLWIVEEIYHNSSRPRVIMHKEEIDNYKYSVWSHRFDNQDPRVLKHVKIIPNSPVGIVQTQCNHSWIGIRMISSTVFNCSKCGIKKEEV